MTQTHILDGKELGQRLKNRVAQEIAKYQSSFTPGLATILVGENPASQIYIKNKIKSCAELGIRSIHLTVSSTITEKELLSKIEDLNRDESVDGILVQMPLPDHISASKIIAAIDPQKDADGFHPMNAGRLMTGESALLPCTPMGCLILLKETIQNLKGLNALVVGRSTIVGRPLAILLLNEDCTVTIAHSKTQDLPSLCQNADILVAALGRPHFIRGDWIKPGAVVIDVGINRIENSDEMNSKKIVGDVFFDEALGRASAITPVPGGVGPMTIACLMYNTYKAATLRRGLEATEII